MFRKSILAIAAVATISAAALVPTTADAKSFKGGFGWGKWGYGVGLGIALAAPLAYGYSYNYGCVGYVVTPSGYLKKAWVPCYY
jgi:hypothetical protein